MSAEERRGTIVHATLPLLEQFGAAVTTRQIADAAGIAEGTIFRVFPDKESLIQAALATVFDPEGALDELSTVDPALPLRERTLAIVEILQSRLERIFQLLTTMGIRPPEPPRQDTNGPHRVHGGEPIMAKVEELLKPDADALRYEIAYSVRVLRLITFAATHPRITNEEPLTAEQIVDLFLHGCLAPTHGNGDS